MREKNRALLRYAFIAGAILAVVIATTDTLAGTDGAPMSILALVAWPVAVVLGVLGARQMKVWQNSRLS